MIRRVLKKVRLLLYYLLAFFFNQLTYFFILCHIDATLKLSVQATRIHLAKCWGFQLKLP